MNVVAAFIANRQTAEAVEPSLGPFDDPAIAPEPLTGIDAPPGNPRRDVPLAQGVSTPVEIIRLVGMQFVRTASWTTTPPTNREDGIQGSFYHPAIMDVGGRLGDAQRDTLSVDHQMAFRARFAAIRWIRTGLRAPLGGGTLVESNAAMDQSICPASFRRSSKR